MSDEVESDYALLSLDDAGTFSSNYAILKRARRSTGAYEIYMPNVGDYRKAQRVLRMLREEENKIREKVVEDRKKWQEHLSAPHGFTPIGPNDKVCYCDKPEEDPIHIDEDAEEETND